MQPISPSRAAASVPHATRSRGSSCAEYACSTLLASSRVSSTQAVMYIFISTCRTRRMMHADADAVYAAMHVAEQKASLRLWVDEWQGRCRQRSWWMARQLRCRGRQGSAGM